MPFKLRWRIFTVTVLMPVLDAPDYGHVVHETKRVLQFLNDRGEWEDVPEVPAGG